jgi:CheY-like chemotaxis protein
MNAVAQPQRDGVVLLVEDNATDVFLTREAFRRCGAKVSILQVDNGEKCLDFLRHRHEYADAPTPDLVLLDLNLPVMDGREVLSELRTGEGYPPLPVVVLSTSRVRADVETAHALGCSSYLFKPLNIDEFDRVIHNLWHYWFRTVVLPTRAGSQ